MNNEDIIKYCTTSPENVNPAILKSMLDGLEGASGRNLFNMVEIGVREIPIESTGAQQIQLTLDKTWEEINELCNTPYTLVYIKISEEFDLKIAGYFLCYTNEYDDHYIVVLGLKQDFIFEALEASEYPSFRSVKMS